MTDPDDMSDRELAKLAEEVADRLERRGVVAGGAGIAAGGALGWLASGEARAGTQSVGTIGSQSDPIDVEAEDVSVDSITDGAGVNHKGELADLNEGVTNFGVGSLSDGEVLANASGSLTGKTVGGNEPDWTETVSGSGSGTNEQISGIGDFDYYLFHIFVDHTNGSVSANLSIETINGNTPTYDFYKADGSTTTGASSLPLGRIDDFHAGVLAFTMSRPANSATGITLQQFPSVDFSLPDFFTYATATLGGDFIDSLVLEGRSNTQWNYQVYGRNI